ncbi:MAG: hypothetical protein Q7O66_19750 [Dehalococcoidia bacterium]|nr:hypothetical protein [Dehalococcoidia bacterium]
MECRWWQHNWGKWEEIERGNVKQKRGDDLHIVGHYVVQERRCSNCDKVQLSRSEV